MAFYKYGHNETLCLVEKEKKTKYNNFLFRINFVSLCVHVQNNNNFVGYFSEKKKRSFFLSQFFKLKK